MPPSKKVEHPKKVAGMAKKAEVAAQKQAVVDAKAAAAETEKWTKGAKSNSKKEADSDKKAEAARKKAERDALLAEEEKLQPSTPKNAKAKTAPKKSRGTLDLDSLDSAPSTAATERDKPLTTLNASGIDNALDALTLTNTSASTLKVEKHPERRFKAAFAAFAARRMDEIAEERPGLRKQQRDEICRKEFQNSEENPFNQVGVVAVDATREEIRETREKWKDGIEGRLGEKENVKGKGKGRA